jgi:hypothetical protein
MSTGTIVIIVVVVVIVVAAAAGVMYDMRRRRLRERFGPEYDRLVEEKGSRTKAEAELVEREKRVKGLDIRPLDPAAQARYTQDWAAIQERFVDAPQEAVTEAQRLVMTVMNERGYPTEGDTQVMADLSVRHADVLDHYRSAYEIGQRAADGLASTEDLRQATIHYRALFQELLGGDTETGAQASTEPAAAEVTPGLPAEDPVVADDPATPAGTIPADTIPADIAADGTAVPADTAVPIDETVPADTTVPDDTPLEDDTAVAAEPAARFEAPDEVDATNGAYRAGRADQAAADDELAAEPADEPGAEREAEPASAAADRPRRRS